MDNKLTPGGRVCPLLCDRPGDPFADLPWSWGGWPVDGSLPSRRRKEPAFRFELSFISDWIRFAPRPL